MAKDNLTKINKTASKILLIIFIIFFIICLIGVGYTAYNLMPVNKEDKKIVSFKIEQGWTSSTIASKLKEKGLIRNDFLFKVYIKLNNKADFKAGNFELSKSMNVDEIIDILTSSSHAIADSITVTFVEGKRFPYYVKKISESFGYTEDEIMKTVTSEEYLDKVIKDYWFITDEIKNDKLYYPLEGYIFADTYTFNKDSSIEVIFDKLLSSMGEKLKSYKEEIDLSGKSVHSLLTMASMVELEAVTPDDRLDVAGVFYNRLNANMAMGSDVTTYYASKKEMTESLYMSELNACNAYNTRGTCAVIFPVGPIASPSYSSIIAAINPNKNDYWYFVADKNNKVYLSKTSSDQDAVIRRLKNQNLWPE